MALQIGESTRRRASAENTPQYRPILREKVRELRGPIGALSETADEIASLGVEIEKQQRGAVDLESKQGA